MLRRILNTLYANTAISRRAKLGNEVINLILCKIEDERSGERTPLFQAGGGADAVKARIDALFGRVRGQLTHDGTFAEHEAIMLDAASVRWVVGQLERGALLETDSDVVGDAFEVFADPALAGEKGEFFTPRGVVKIAVRLANPQPLATICDPACGPGGFLIQAMEHVWDAMERQPQWQDSPDLAARKREMATRSIHGIDKEADLVRIAKAYMAISGDGGSGNIVHDNSLRKASEMTPAGKRHFVDGQRLRQFDFVMTNPPYGAKTKVLPMDCRPFALGHMWARDDAGHWKQTAQVPDTGRDPYILFVERCLDMLRSGGTLAIVLPETVFHARNLGYLRQFILRGNSISAIISLPHNTFRPHCNAKTCLVLLRKDQPQQERILMANPREMGHDHQGKAIYKPGTDEVWDDLGEILDEIDAPGADHRFLFTVDAGAINQDILIPAYYEGLMNTPRLPSGRRGVTLGELVDSGFIEAWDGHGSPPATAKGNGPVPYIRVSDIVNWEMYRNPVSGIPEETYRRILGGKRQPEAGDVVFVRRGSYRIGTVAMASPRDSEVLLTREILSFRVVGENPYGITPFYLLFLLASRYVQDQIPCRVFIDTTLPNLGDRWRELLLPIHENRTEAHSVGIEVERAIRSKWRAQEHIDALRESSGGLTT